MNEPTRPDIAPKMVTPPNMRKRATTRPPFVIGATSPYPTVVIVAADHHSASLAVLMLGVVASASKKSTARAPNIQAEKEKKHVMAATDSGLASARISPVTSTAFITRMAWKRRKRLAARSVRHTFPPALTGKDAIQPAGTQEAKSRSMTPALGSVSRCSMMFLGWPAVAWASPSCRAPHGCRCRRRCHRGRKSGRTYRLRKSTKKRPQTAVSACSMMTLSWSSKLPRAPPRSSGTSHSTAFRPITRSAMLPRKSS
mmetsp:Transcript_27049/g.85612  ORF Transcript_27049/g.85612 Transcript_27049/m.85612 type:complete len:256 (-) Transcript_27049:108-875(-)